MNKVRRVGRIAAATAAVTVLAVTASGCVTVHGERVVVPSATKADAAEALDSFTDAYNKAYKAHDPALGAGRVTGAYGAINQADLKAKQKVDPDGDPGRTALELTDAKIAVPEQAGWPKFFLADTDSNFDTDNDSARDNRWLLVFTKAGVDEKWKASNLTIVSEDKVPELRMNAKGLAEAVPPSETSLATAPGKLSKSYADYLSAGQPGGAFAPGAHTTGWLGMREKEKRKRGFATQYKDQPLTGGAFAPVALRTTDGHALVFFATRYFKKVTAAQGVDLPVKEEDRALMSGEATESMVLEHVTNVVAVDPAAGAYGGKVIVLGHIEDVTGAEGE